MRMTIYTGRGDDGRTDLHSRERVSKASPRIEAYGTVDELNALIGTIRPMKWDDLDNELDQIQQHLHVIQAELANPAPDEETPAIEAAHVETLEEWIEGHEETLEPLTSFLLPGGNEAGGGLHHARTVCRRAERRVISLHEADPVNPALLTYLNRLSDLLFVQARVANDRGNVEETHPTYE